ncbi:Guanine nucleotide-binding protein subunit beta-1 [Bienertia sinuspersici]
MVKFKFEQSSAGHFLVLKDGIDGHKKTWKIEHYPPHLKNWVSGKSPKAILNSSHHHEKVTTKSLSLLYDRISRREVTWTPKLQFKVMFSNIPLYWEWTEDINRRCRTTLMKTDLIDAVYASMFHYKCNSPLIQCFCEFWYPTTNTVLTRDDEASISLWDLKILGELLIYSVCYDDVVPTALELEGSKDGKQFFPPSYKYMIPESWSNKHEALTFLNVPKQHRQPTYLAVFLSFWLYPFVLPLKNLGCIHPSVFKPASQLASGQRISLATHVLASIYRGLNELSCSSTRGKSCNNFSAHYVHAWTAQYFRSQCMSVHDFASAQMIAFYGASNV